MFIPDTFNVDDNVVNLFNRVVPETCNNTFGLIIPIPTFSAEVIETLSKTVTPVLENVFV
jgi:hypothetical protein